MNHFVAAGGTSNFHQRCVSAGKAIAIERKRRSTNAARQERTKSAKYAAGKKALDGDVSAYANCIYVQLDASSIVRSEMCTTQRTVLGLCTR